MKKLFRNRKAVSPVIATVLMILVTMAGMSILFGAVVTYSDSFRRGTGSSVLESITVEDSRLSPSANSAELYLFNTGKIDVKVTNVYINGQMATISPSSLSIAEGKHDKLTVTAPFNFESGHVYDFKIVTQRGTGFEGTYLC